MLTDKASIIIESTDLGGSSASDTSDYFKVFDGKPPIANVLKPLSGYPVKEYSDLTVQWSASDNIELESIEVYFSNNAGKSFALKGTAPADSTQLTFTIPMGATDSALVKLVPIDIAGNKGEALSHFFKVLDNTPPTVDLLTPQTGEALEIASYSTITWDAQDNVGVHVIDMLFSSDGGSSWGYITASEPNTGSYNWLVPNLPTDNLSLRLIGYDKRGLADTSDVVGLSIFITYPKLVSVSPEPGLITWRDNVIEMGFSQVLDPQSLTSENFSFTSNYSDAVLSSFSYNDSLNIVTMTLSRSFASLDTVTITLSGSGINNLYGYGFDGNSDGTPGDDYNFSYNTSMLADYDNSNSIDLLDLTQFIQALDSKDYYYELGPVSGSAPHLMSDPDGQYNIDDVMGLVMMWNWYASNNLIAYSAWPSEGEIIEIEADKDSLFIRNLPEETVAYELLIDFDPFTFKTGKALSSTEVSLSNMNTESGVYIFMSSKEFSDMAIPISINGKSSEIKVSLRAAGHNGEILAQTSKTINISNIPDQFSLHQNYPNPFNPTTTIAYDLPEDVFLTLEIYDLLGRKVRTLVNKQVEAGYHKSIWDGRDDFGIDLSSGFYFYRVSTANYNKTQKMVLLK